MQPPYCLVIQLSLNIIQLSPEGEVNSGAGIYLALFTDPAGDSCLVFITSVG